MSLSSEEHSDEQVVVNPALRDDTKFASGKIAFLQYTAVAIFLFLITGFWDLQVRNQGFYDEAAERNRIKSLPILAPRGKILDRDGRVIVDNHASFSLILSRESLKPEHIHSIADGLNLEYDRVQARLDRFRFRPRYEPIIIKEELSPGELAFVESHNDPETFPEMELIRAQRRLYPQNNVAAHLVGYVGEISENELNSPEYIEYDPGDVIGKQGIEKQYNRTLMGVDGQRQVVVDNRGRERAVLKMKEAVPGKDLTLTIDLDLQTVGELAMQNKNGAVVALDPRNGEVLTLVSTPAYDPNKFAGRIRSDDWKLIVNNPDNPMLDRSIQAQFAPGSTFKPIVALAGLETGTVDDQYSIRCPGGASFYGHYFKCWQKGGHGSVSLHRGLAQSCDVYFYNVGNKLGIDNIAKYAEMAGFGHKTGIDLPHEASGTVPSTEWKMKNFRQKWYAGETISVAIGQGALTVTPIQLASAIGGLAMGGAWYKPHLVKTARPDPPRIVKLDPSNAGKVVSGMYGVVNEGGTGGRARLPGVSVCGKTGSAQLASNALLKGSASHKMKDNAWFVAFAPCESPEIVVSVLFENGQHGYLAAPVARDVIKAYFDKKKARELANAPLRASAPSPAQWGPWLPAPASRPKPGQEPQGVDAE